MKLRADQLLVKKNICPTIEQAKIAIMSGQVRIGTDHLINKANQLIDEQQELHLVLPCPYVSRGAYKLKIALDTHKPNLKNCIAIDLGASTGGFSDLLLQNGVKKIFAIDSGYGQLHLKLRQDKRIINLERTNARHLTNQQITEPVDIITADVSFISLKTVLPPAATFLKKSGWAMVLIKPQFEAKRHEVEKGGVVRNKQIRQRVIQEICTFAQTKLNWKHLETIPSPIKGPKGNQEYIAVFQKEK